MNIGYKKFDKIMSDKIEIGRILMDTGMLKFLSSLS